MSLGVGFEASKDLNLSKSLSLSALCLGLKMSALSYCFSTTPAMLHSLMIMDSNFQKPLAPNETLCF